MKLELRPMLDMASRQLKGWAMQLKVHQFWVRLAAFTLLTVATMAVVGRSAYARAESLDAETARLRGIEQGMSRLIESMIWPAPEETTHWRESDDVFRRLSSTNVDPLTLANDIAQHSEEVGPADIKIGLARPDSAYVPAPEEMGGWLVTSGRTALVLQTSGSWGETISVLGTLPPQVEVAGLELSSTGSSVGMRALLLSREFARGGP